MGLGKTVQSVSLVRMIKERYAATLPVLVVAPLSTLGHWDREFKHWTNLDVMILLDDAAPLARTKWSAIIVDEAHRLKNPQSRLYRALHGDDGRFASIFKLLLTGTPLQNDMRELWALLSFCDTETFGEDHEEFLAVVPRRRTRTTTRRTRPGVLSSLLEEMRPFVLRRVKAHVETSVPPKEEIVVSVALAAMQKRYYRALKNVTMLAGGGRAVDGPSMMNLAMELRKCCNHPFLLKGVEFRELESSGHGVAEVDRLVDACGKLQFMDKILPKLFDEQRKVLVFSQFTMMLNVLEDYLRARAVVYGRIDGGVTGRDRQRQIDAFSDAGSKMRLMLLSTRAGGVGINLVAADTVIIYDSDWNPQNDVQAMARCHRIGQTKKVTVYRLLTAKTYEAHMYDVATAKLDLDRAVLDGMASHSKGNAQLHESLLKRGATAVAFQQGPEEDDDADAVAFRNQSIDDILATRTKAVVLASNDSGGALESLSSATFTVGAGYKSPGKKPEDRSARAARGGFKHYDEAGRTAYDAAYVDDGNSDDDAHASAFDRVKKKKRSKKEAQVDEDFEDAPKKEKPKHPHDWSKTQIRELRLQLQKRPIGLAGADFVRGGLSLARREDPADALSAASDAIVSSAKASLLQGAYNADSEIQHGIDRAQVEKLWRRNKAVKHCLKHRVGAGRPRRPRRASGALIAFEPTPGPLGVELCAAPGRDADGKHGKLLDVALGLGRVSVCNRAAPWWDARHDLCLVRGVTRHGTLASEQRRVDVLEDASLGWPDDMPRPPPRLDVEPADADEVASNAPSQAPSSLDDAAPPPADAPDAKAPEAKKPNPSRKAPKRLEHLPSRAKLNSRLKALVAGVRGGPPSPRRRARSRRRRAAGPSRRRTTSRLPAPAPADDPAKENGRDAPDRRDR
ncbi:helicase [Aureococcus anophagefferens]|nr:helicase [Aureococcus anophagefferens]